MRATLAILAALSTGAAACTTNDMQQAPVEQALSQPFKDLSLIREETPELLKSAAKGPYSNLPSCSAITQEISQLNTHLGRDFDNGADSQGQTGAMIMSQLIGGVVDIPFRGVIRHVTGAHKREQDKAEAIVASIARRGYLRGLAAERGCDGSKPGASAASVAQAPSPAAPAAGVEAAATAPTPSPPVIAPTPTEPAVPLIPAAPAGADPARAPA